MKYLRLVYLDTDRWSAVPDRECETCSDELHSSRKLLTAEPLHPVETAKTVRIRLGNVSVTDGPFAGTKEMLAGFHLIDTGDMDEAVQIASRIPPARVGSIEVRPVRDLQP